MAINTRELGVKLILAQQQPALPHVVCSLQKQVKAHYNSAQTAYKARVSYF